MPFYHVWFATKNRKWLLNGDVGERPMGVMLADEGGLDTAG